jgi:hypothetical protein
MPSSSSASSGRRRRSSSKKREEPKGWTVTGILGAVCLLVALGLVIALFVKVVNDNPAPQPPPGAVAARPYTPPLEPTGDPTPPKDLDMTLEQYCAKLDSFGEEGQPRIDFIRQTAGSRVSWRAKVLHVESTSMIRRVALGSTVAGSDRHVNALFDHPSTQVVNVLFLLQMYDTVQVTGTISPDNPNEINGDDIQLLH